MSSFGQFDFSGGMDLITPDIGIASTCYKYLINGRVRFGSPEAIRKPSAIAAPAGKKQGLYAVGNILVAFIAGKAYYNLPGNAFWIRIADFQLDPNVDFIYSVSVQSSTINNARTLSVANNINGGVNLQSSLSVAGTPAGLLCQDGINQPWLIFYDAGSNTARARVTKGYNDWSNTNPTQADSREYVPIGKQMFVYSGILYIVSNDGYNVFRSVTGRQLDFMVIIDINGNKLATEDLGGALRISFSVGFDQITYIGPLDDTHFLIATGLNLYAITPDRTVTIYGEPQFITPVLFGGTGIVNQFSVCDNLGNTTLIDFESVKSFNGITQFKFSGKNEPFSIFISKLLINPLTNKAIRQNVCCATNFDDYILMALNTRMGYAVVIYDMLSSKWVSIDITACSKVKQFAITQFEDETLLYAITDNDEMFQIYGSDERETAILRPKGYIAFSQNFLQGSANYDQSSGNRKTHKTIAIRPTFSLGQESGQVMAEELVDEKRGIGNFRTLPLKGVTCGVKPPIFAPVTPDTDKLIDNKMFPFNDGEQGFTISCILRWNTDAKLIFLQIDTSAISQNVSKEQVVENLTNLLTA